MPPASESAQQDTAQNANTPMWVKEPDIYTFFLRTKGDCISCDGPFSVLDFRLDDTFADSGPS